MTAARVRVVYSIGRYHRQAKAICDAVIGELRRRGWLHQLRFFDEPDEAIADCDVFHGHSVLSLATLRYLRAHRPGVRIVLQRDSAHIACEDLRDELRRRRGGPFDALCVEGRNVGAACIPDQCEEYALADRVLVPSTYAAATFAAAGFPAARTCTIAFSADGVMFQPPATRPVFRVVLGGGATLTKGYPYALAACERIGEPLDVIEGVAYEAMPAALARRTVCLSPSVTDAMNHQTLAAMATGLVPIVSTTTGCRDYIRHGETGFIVDLGRGDAVAEIAAILDRLRRAPAAMYAIGDRARAAVVARPEVDYGRDVCELYRALAQEAA
ncbi:MAG TPA: glycosyltransferase [Kofleriaceae bacterium]|nr:glycosyltransferase [Kofleriaceae bacterium]